MCGVCGVCRGGRRAWVEAMLLEARADPRAPPRRLARDLRRYLHNNQLATLPERVFAGLASLEQLCVRARVV